MTTSFIVADVFDGLAKLPNNSIDLVVTSPPFLALRSYLPEDHPNKDKEIGSEANPALFIDTLLDVTTELRRVLAPHGSICVELGDTYSGSGGAGGDYDEGGLREGQQRFRQRNDGGQYGYHGSRGGEKYNSDVRPITGGVGWPLAKSRTLIPESYRWALAYGRNPFGGASHAGQWIVRNKVTWCRPNPPVGRLGDKWRPATSDMVIACTSPDRYWDDVATRKPHVFDPAKRSDKSGRSQHREDSIADSGNWDNKGHPAGAPLLDYWEIIPAGYNGAHYAVYPPALVEPCVKAMAPSKVCRTCGEPSRRIANLVGYVDSDGEDVEPGTWASGIADGFAAHTHKKVTATRIDETVGWTDCGCNSHHCSSEYPCDEHWRRGMVLDPFAGSGTTLHVADALGRDAIGIDIDERNKTLYESRRDDKAFNIMRQMELL